MTATLPDRPREMYAKIVNNVVDVAKTFCELRAYVYSVAEIYKTLEATDFGSDNDMAAFKAAAFDIAAHLGIPIPDFGTTAGQEATEERVKAAESWPVDMAIQSILGDEPKATCAVNLRSGLMLQGDLSRTEWGQLRLVSTAAGKTVEYFFDYDDICVVAREIPSISGDQPSLIVKS